MVKQFVDENHYEIIMLEDGENIDFRVHVDKDYVAHIIGKSGRTAKAIRTIVRAASHDSDKKYTVYVEER